MDCEGIKATSWTLSGGNVSTIQSLMNQQGELIDESGDVQGLSGALQPAFQGGENGLENRLDITDFLAELLHFSGQDAECCEGSSFPEEVTESMADCSMGKAPGFDTLLYELHTSMSDLFGYLLAGVFTNWQQNGLIPRSMCQ